MSVIVKRSKLGEMYEALDSGWEPFTIVVLPRDEREIWFKKQITWDAQLLNEQLLKGP